MRSALSAAVRPTLSASTSTGIGAFLKVRPFPGPEWIVNTDPISIKCSERIRTGLHESATVFAPSPVIHQTLKRFAKQARNVWHTGNPEAACSDLGVTPEEMQEAIQGLSE